VEFLEGQDRVDGLTIARIVQGLIGTLYSREVFWGCSMVEAWDILYLGHFEVGTLGLESFRSWDVLELGRFTVGNLCIGTFCIWDVFRLGRFVLECFVGVP
jgi:hypothetical protein